MTPQSLCLRLAAAGIWLLRLTAAAPALGPHEVLVLANAASPGSMRVARAFAAAHGVPRENLVDLALPESWSAGRLEIAPDEFERHILAPATETARSRGLAGHILAWAYSKDFPVRVTTRPPTSLTGATFVRGRFPPERDIEDARFVSPLYAGPHGRRGAAHLSQTLDVSAFWLGEDMPLPAMMLGVTAPRGNTVEQVVETLERSARSRDTAAVGAVFFELSDDVRSRCRQWQFAGAVEELAALGVRAVAAHGEPPAGEPLMGVSMGRAVLPAMPGLRLAPGALAEHLTSFGAVFENAGQTKLTEWIARGAAASCGTITEPRAIWSKFPTARLHVHYAAGCTAIESFYQAVRSPLQLLIVGDPLAAPYARADCRARLRGLTDKPASGMLRLELVLDGLDAGRFGRTAWWVNGRPAGEGRVLWLDAARMAPGANRVRRVAAETGFVRRQVWAEGSLTVPGREQEEEEGE